MRLDRLCLVTGAALALLIASTTPSPAPEPGMGRGNDHNSNAGGSNSGPGHEGSSNRDSVHQRAAAGHFTSHPGDRDSDQYQRWQRMEAIYGPGGGGSAGAGRGGRATPSANHNGNNDCASCH